MTLAASTVTLASRHAHATFDRATGNLLELRSDPEASSIIRRIFCWHRNDGRTTSESPADGEAPFAVDQVKFSDEAVESVLRSEEVEIRRRFELGPRDALLRVHYQIRPLSGTKLLERGVFPHIDFAADFADAYEDERDLYHDGAEVGDGRESPCWRVFFQQGQDAGLILVTRCKEQMSHVQIEERGIDVRPHLRINYSSNYELPGKPIPFTGRRGYRVGFEIGPWSRQKHKTIFRVAKLGTAVDVGNPPPQGKPGRKPKGKVFYAHRFAAPAVASTDFRPNRWMIVKVPWAQQGKALFAGTGVRVRPITLKPGRQLRNGDYRMFVGVGNATAVKLHLQGDPEMTFRMLPYAARKARRRTFDLMLSGRQRANEIEIGVVPFKGRKITFHRWPDLHESSMIDYARFVPLSRDEAAREERARGRRPRTMLTGMADAPDMSLMVDSFDPSPEAPRSIIWEHARCGYSKVYWRIDGQCSDFPSKTNTMRYPSARGHGMFVAMAKVYGRLLRRFDLLRAVVDAGNKYGVDVWGWMRFNNYSGNVQSQFFRDHPEYHEVWENGERAMKLCLAFPQVRKHKIDILVEAAKYGLGGLNLGILRHAPVIHRHPILVEGYRKLYGADPPLKLDREDQTHRFSLAPTDDEHQRWFRYRAGFLTQFGRELRGALRDAGLAKVKVSLWLRPQHHLYDGIDLDDWLAEGLCDEVVASARTFVDEPLPVAEPTADWRRNVQAKVPLLRGIWAHDLPFATANYRRWIDDEGYAGLSTYESNAAVLDPEFIDFYQSLRR